ncbi:hypothetical protein CMV_024802 [Castanea mollissima]|uniref:Uncharacterized protein n=1 Tax=Castanea mollissima TaxID=60419 RepID=A0A8J4VC40_9ROSI|nr:hypothetical protein CMV_024802 [Castanea mollissima]
MEIFIKKKQTTPSHLSTTEEKQYSGLNSDSKSSVPSNRSNWIQNALDSWDAMVAIEASGARDEPVEILEQCEMVTTLHSDGIDMEKATEDLSKSLEKAIEDLSLIDPCVTTYTAEFIVGIELNVKIGFDLPSLCSQF